MIYFFVPFNELINILKAYLPFISSSLFTFNLVILYLDDWKLSKIKGIKCLQIFSFICIFFTIISLAYSHTIWMDIINYAKDSNDNVNLHAHGDITVYKEAGKAIGQGLSTIVVKLAWVQPSLVLVQQ